jgi:hypothetical protein
MPTLLVVLAVLIVFVSGCDKSKPAAAAGGAASGTASAPPSPATQPGGAQVKVKTPGAPPPAWKPIAGGQECRFAGVTANVPAGWNVVPQGNSTILLPAGATQGVINEIYGFVGDPSLKSLDSPLLEPYLDQAVMQLLQVPAQRAGPGEEIKVGALDGKTWKWTATLMDGRNVEVRSWSFVGSYAGALVAIATPDALKARMGELEQILGSVHRPAAAAISAAQLCNTWVRAFGGGTALIGNANEQQITFDASGRFHYHSEGTSHGVFHNISSQTDITGSWRLDGDQLSGVCDTGESGTFTLEARTEANTGAAVIAIDGTEFRQVNGRPW